ncbi:Translation initiation factor IF-1 chloroplastic [Bienertia sinuspersici]
MFWVHLDNEYLILGYASGRIQRSSIQILQRDEVKIKVSRYNSTRGINSTTRIRMIK